MYFDINDIIARELNDMRKMYKVILESIRADEEMVRQRNALTGQCGADSLYKSCTSEGEIYYRHSRYKGKQHSQKLGGERNKEVIRIKQRKYNDEMSRRLKRNIDLLDGIVGRFLPYDQDAIDDQLGHVYKDETGLVNKAPGTVSLEEWEGITKKNSYKMPDDSNIAPDGLETRSKSELIVYSILRGYGLEVKYDYELTLRNSSGQSVAVAPDFIVLCNDGSLILIEHLGLMDDFEYLNNAINRIYLYQMNGYKLNEDLFLTADYAKGKINACVIDEIVRKMILPRVG